MHVYNYKDSICEQKYNGYRHIHIKLIYNLEYYKMYLSLTNSAHTNR